MYVMQSQNKGLASLPVRGVWIEILKAGTLCRPLTSLLARGVWIEIIMKIKKFKHVWKVTPREGECELKNTVPCHNYL